MNVKIFQSNFIVNIIDSKKAWQINYIGDKNHASNSMQIINFVIVPALVLIIGKIFLIGADEKFALWAVGLFLIGVLPTSGMTISWTGFAKGNKEAAIKMVVFGLIIGALAAPIYTKIFMGATIEVNMLHMFKQIAIFVFGPAPKDSLQEPVPEESKEAVTSKPPLEPVIAPGESMSVSISKILFATDLSKISRHAVKYACNIGNKYNAPVWAIHVVPDILSEYASQVGIDLSHTTDSNKKEDLNKGRIDLAKTAIRERMSILSKTILEEVPSCPLSKDKIIVKAGSPVDEIVTTAKNDNFDLIIMGTHGHSDFEEMMMLGSTANGVIRKSNVPVLVARPE